MASRRVGLPPLVDLGEPVPHRLDEQAAALRIVEEVVLQIRIAVDDPDVAQHLEQHPRRAPGPPLAAKPLEDRPHVRAEQPDHDLAIGERRVVVGDLAQPGRFGVHVRDVGSGRRLHSWSRPVYRTATSQDLYRALSGGALGPVENHLAALRPRASSRTPSRNHRPRSDA